MSEGHTSIDENIINDAFGERMDTMPSLEKHDEPPKFGNLNTRKQRYDLDMFKSHRKLGGRNSKVKKELLARQVKQ